MTTPKLLKVGDVAEMLNTSVKCVYALVAARRLPCIRLGRAVRFRESVIAAWIDAHAVDAIDPAAPGLVRRPRVVA